MKDCSSFTGGVDILSENINRMVVVMTDCKLNWRQGQRMRLPQDCVRDRNISMLLKRSNREGESGGKGGIVGVFWRLFTKPNFEIHNGDTGIAKARAVFITIWSQTGGSGGGGNRGDRPRKTLLSQ